MIDSLKNKFHHIINEARESKYVFLIACIIYFFNSIGNIGQGVFIKYFIKNNVDLNLYEFMCFRCVISIVLLLPFNIKNIKNHFKLSDRFFKLSLMISLFYALDIFLWNLGLQTVPVNNGTIIMLLIPIWISILSRFFLQEKDFSLFHLISFTLGFIGVIVSIKGHLSFSNFNYGYLFIFINTFIVATGLILQKKYRDKRPVSYALFLNALVSLIFFFLLNLNTSFERHINFSNIMSFVLNKNLILMAFIIAIFDIIEYAAVYTAYSLYNVSSLQPIRFTRIVVSAFLSYLFLNEKITIYQFISITIIICANIIIPVGKKIKNKKKP